MRLKELILKLQEIESLRGDCDTGITTHHNGTEWSEDILDISYSPRTGVELLGSTYIKWEESMIGANKLIEENRELLDDLAKLEEEEK